MYSSYIFKHFKQKKEHSKEKKEYGNDCLHLLKISTARPYGQAQHKPSVNRLAAVCLTARKRGG